MTLFSAHQMSSCRMAGSPQMGVVSPAGESFEVKDLFVADASALPTATGVNPMISIMALSHRVAQAIKARV
jgi:choline dehydrogenase-like flavoprotein